MDEINYCVGAIYHVEVLMTFSPVPPVPSLIVDVS